MRISNMSNFELLRTFESLAFAQINYPKNKSISKKFETAEKELAKRLGLSESEINELVF